MPNGDALPILYPFIMLAALATGAWLLRKSQSSLQLRTDQKLAIGIAAFCGAMLGAKAPFLLYDFSGFLDGTAWFASGKTIMCGMVGAYLAVEITKYILEIRTKTGDSFAVPVAVTVGIGRLGCLVAGCCYGVPTSLPWGMRCALTDQLYRHPTQIYESAFHFLMAAVLAGLQRRDLLTGQLVKLYIMVYLVYRFFSEFIRPEADFGLGLTAYQWFSILLLPVFGLLWKRDQRLQIQAL